MTTLLTSELIERCHAGSRAKGFWDTTPPQGQQLMLVISELAESLEAHRKGRTCKGEFIYKDYDNAFFKMAFEETVKNTVEDELADAYIRLCDFVGGYGLDVDGLVATESEWHGLLKEVSGSGRKSESFGESLLLISHDIAAGWVNNSETLTEVSLGTAMAEIRLLAEQEGIDLATHIDLKLRYNATRPARHGKAY